MYREVNVFGVYVAPFVVMMLIAWAATIPLGILGARLQVRRWVWHPGLFNLSVYLIVLSTVVVVCGAYQ
ncbi:DUF1656 domain-containing protein [Rhodopseudomonas telluris]|uniref:DUF1656 domain-containing protein n=1 Tax=Rhodopseudomonas telluris TaxID=644215 RepID=A0ABV6ELQ9_9BRAD